MKIGTMELLVILIVAFLVLGPEKTVIYARKLGKWLRTLKTYINSITEDLKDTVVEPLKEIQEPLKDITKQLGEMANAVENPVNDLSKTLENTTSETYVKPKANETNAHEIVELEQAELIEEAETVTEICVSADLEEANAEKACTSKGDFVLEASAQGRDLKL